MNVHRAFFYLCFGFVTLSRSIPLILGYGLLEQVLVDLMKKRRKKTLTSELEFKQVNHLYK